MGHLARPALGLLIASFLTIVAQGDEFTSTGSMTSSRQSHTATRLLDGRVLVVAGFNLDQPQLATAELYNPSTGTWTWGGSLSSPLAGHAATLLHNGKVLITGGIWYSGEYGPLITSASQLYGPTSYTWSNLGPATEIPPGSGQFQFTDHQATNHPQRFYRVSSP